MMNSDKIAVVFPGQGSQKPGMGKDFYQDIPVCRQTYEEAADALGWDVAAMCFGGDEKLHLTEYTQPCIVTTEIAMLRGLSERFGFAPSYFGGHSLGEFTALVAAGVFSLSETLKTVQARGKLMQEAVPVGVGGMAAIISEEIDIKKLRQLIFDLPVDIANINSVNQVVISGKLSALPEAEKRLTEALTGQKPMRFVQLNVSAPFHSRFMQPIEDIFDKVLLNKIKNIETKNAPNVTSNYTGSFHVDNAVQIRGNLVRQLSNTVNWCENMCSLASQTANIFEVGPGRPLRDFFRTIGISCTSITGLAAAQKSFAGRD
ncbi:MAG TPA: ACP S-malonyltransferase [Smithellaceae bacterium]|jgi:[acyl-carrier-protein] S-malonyltransferase/trans-AT polyketide synthase/acyltransferase/oxidoreductase domain-containing protein|nr:ACP S-malonyltransferase [Smithellaceae bacterium]HNT90464.1 ACP S-malonyltransferase [Smithellaceae bacterium]HNV63692.1 ACP S-malonyltransferase [Smithellaceae bacterium]HNZ31330.1 ACP S-malonyltransferase [Smithellaceae bacterium]HOD30868.1 ACP S-malonyltransferase [Smithellaceae bacterium]